MIENFRPPYEVEEDNKNTQKTQNSEAPNSRVDSLVDNDEGAVIVGSGKKTALKNKIKKIWGKGLSYAPSSKKQKIIGSSIAAVIIVLGAGGVYALNQMFKPKPDPQVITSVEPKTSEPSKLTGVEVPLKENEKRVIGVMIENSPEARPQAGLQESGIVFEAIAEGGITRFLTLHLEGNPKNLGPVRSVRPYYAEWASGFDAALGHAGGSAEGLARLGQLKIPDLDYTIAGGAYSRVSDRYAPHNLFTSMSKLRSEAKRLKYQKPSKFTGLQRKKETKNIENATVKSISFSLSGALYDTKYTYDAKNNNYKRLMAGTAHRDKSSGKQISPKVVVALVTKYSQKGIYSVYRTAGSGQVIVFQDGKAQKGVWKRKDVKDSLQFYTSDGQPLRINPGQTWITAIGNAGAVKYGP